MSLFDIKQKMAEGGQAGKPGAGEKPLSGEEKEAPDKSAFGGKKYLGRTETERWFKRPERFSATGGLKEAERGELVKELFPQNRFGQFIQKEEAERVLNKIQRGETPLPPGKKENIIKTLKQFLGK